MAKDNEKSNNNRFYWTKNPEMNSGPSHGFIPGQDLRDKHVRKFVCCVYYRRYFKFWE
jgi:hypothetical protein